MVAPTVDPASERDRFAGVIVTQLAAVNILEQNYLLIRIIITDAMRKRAKLKRRTRMVNVVI